MAKTVFHIVSENPQEQHIAKKMQPTTMHEHGAKERHGFGRWSVGKTCGDKRPFFDELIASTQFQQKDKDVQQNERVGNDREPPHTRIVVTDWKHLTKLLTHA
jgi:hypothetical protein